MSMRMLIDARHREETRVAVVKGNRVEEFDFESEEHKQLKGNIYLAKVTRVEPSLQAAFVDYGGNRHGFLAFSEIHPDYYQIPKEDREALLREEAEHAAAEEALRARDADHDEDDEEAAAADAADEGAEEHAGPETLDADEEYDGDEEPVEPAPKPAEAGADDNHAVESLRQKRMNLRRRYKIQDVIRRRQVLLVQVVKEERGNKGAALTTYLSLAGRYCVLMPNTSHGGGVSRKIANGADRKRLKAILADLNLPNSMGCIVRTAGLQRSTAEIKRDFDYLARLWDEIREKTLASSAPSEIYRDSDLVKRAIRDIYSKEVDEVIVEGEEGYRAAKSFMKLLMPGHSRKITPYADAVPLFQRHGVEDQLAAMYQPVVQLKSGGYLVINPTEALVSIDINSGRATREHNIEQTALNTNLEAAHEIARQLRLRDMAGLIVIDFIDMESNSNNRKVERAIKEALKSDRARIQVGRISGFGLFEMSRQRLRTGMLEASTRLCPHCEGSGFIRTASSSGLQALRLLEEEAARGHGSQLCLRASQEAALYVLNRKRAELADIEDRYGVMIEVISDGTPEGARMGVQVGGPPPSHAPRLPQPVAIEPDDEFEELDDIEEGEDASAVPGEEDGDQDGRRRRRRRRRRGGRREEGELSAAPEEAEAIAAYDEPGEDAEPDAALRAAEADVVVDGTADTDEERGRRGRRGGRRRGREADEVSAAADEAEAVPAFAIGGEEAAAGTPGATALPTLPEAEQVAAFTTAGAAPEGELARAEADVVVAEPVEEAPRPRRRPRARKAAEPEADAVQGADPGDLVADEAAAAPKRRRATRAVAEDDAPGRAPRRRKATPATEAAPEAERALAVADEPSAPSAGAVVEPALESTGETASPRRGWWQRTFGS